MIELLIILIFSIQMYCVVFENIHLDSNILKTDINKFIGLV